MAGPEIMQERFEQLFRDVGDIKLQLQHLNAGMERLARLEERFANQQEAITRAFTKLSNHEERIIGQEIMAPITKLVSRWVIGGVAGVVVLVGAQIVALVMLIPGAGR